jgi:rubredoxin
MPDAIACPHCGASMNRHAEKLLQDVDEGRAGGAGSEGLVVSIHECPACGWVEERPEGPL